MALDLSEILASKLTASNVDVHAQIPRDGDGGHQRKRSCSASVGLDLSSTYVYNEPEDARGYSPEVVEAIPTPIYGYPDEKRIAHPMWNDTKLDETHVYAQTHET